MGYSPRRTVHGAPQVVHLETQIILFLGGIEIQKCGLCLVEEHVDSVRLAGGGPELLALPHEGLHELDEPFAAHFGEWLEEARRHGSALYLLQHGFGEHGEVLGADLALDHETQIA